ncbi:hypothetical protein Nepgr_000428 [Nepenthes gracilis]|uniref:Uncharacterized protein n=1 Tax=Nepenthes gracilis TaxID=150966 RepID=A0AAD3P2Y8_NEPGR|nr:hypothetical protein Nepgr_000428 [Nepenthes gracilis]
MKTISMDLLASWNEFQPKRGEEESDPNPSVWLSVDHCVGWVRNEKGNTALHKALSMAKECVLLLWLMLSEIDDKFWNEIRTLNGESLLKNKRLTGKSPLQVAIMRRDKDWIDSILQNEPSPNDYVAGYRQMTLELKEKPWTLASFVIGWVRLTLAELKSIGAQQLLEAKILKAHTEGSEPSTSIELSQQVTCAIDSLLLEGCLLAKSKSSISV